MTTEPRREHLELYVPEQRESQWTYRTTVTDHGDGTRTYVYEPVPEPTPVRRPGCLSLCVALVVVLWRVGW